MNAEPSESIESTGIGETADGAHPPVEAAHWSDRAVRRLTQAQVIGLLAVVIGAGSFVAGEAQSTYVGGLLSSGGLTLLVAGFSVIVGARRLRSVAPDQPFRPGSITSPRMWFVLTWGAGLAVAVLLSVKFTGIAEQLIML